MQTTIVNNEEDFAFFLNSDVHQIMDIYCPNDNYVILQWQFKDANMSKNSEEKVKNILST